MKNNCSRRKFIRSAATGGLGLSFADKLTFLYGKNSLFEKSNIEISATISEVQSMQGANYEWLKHARIFIIDAYNYPLYPKIEFDAERLADTMDDMHANVLRIATSGFGDWLIPGTEFKVSKDLGDRDILAESIAACKPHGIKVVPYLQCGARASKAVMKPEWAQVVNPVGDVRSSALCWNTPYKEAFYDLVKTVVSKYDIDGVYFDSWYPFYGFSGRICYCEGCKKGFKELSGEDIPYREKGEKYTPRELETIDIWREWYIDRMFEAFSETKRIIKSYKDIPLIYNIYNPTRILDKFQNDMRIMEGSDAFLYERSKNMIERAEGVSLATAHGIVVWPYVGNYDPFPRIPHFKYELVQEIFTSVAFGGSPNLYHSYFFVEHPESRGPIKEAFKIIDENYEWFKGFSSDKFCAVVWNDNDPAGHADSGYLWDVNARLSSLGSFSACIKNHIQTTSLLKIDLNNIELLNEYKVIYLPDICYLTDKQITNITNFVDNGGGLVITYATSLYDEKGKKDSDFSLTKLAKISYHNPDEKMSEKMNENYEYGSVRDMYLKTRHGQKIIKSPLSDKLIPTHVYETVDVLPGGTVIADIVTGCDKEPLTPGLIVSQYGKGKVAYISTALGAMYLQTGIKEFSDFISNVIEYVSPDGVPYEIDAPHATLITNMTVNGNKRVFHFVNWPGSQSERMTQNVYNIPPIDDVKIKFKIPKKCKISKISSFVPVDFSQKQEKDVLHITLKRVEKYQGIVIELEY